MDDWDDEIDEETSPCPECGADVWWGADQCPACGHWFTGDDDGSAGGSGVFAGRPLWWVVLGGLGIAVTVIALAL